MSDYCTCVWNVKGGHSLGLKGHRCKVSECFDSLDEAMGEDVKGEDLRERLYEPDDEEEGVFETSPPEFEYRTTWVRLGSDLHNDSALLDKKLNDGWVIGDAFVTDSLIYFTLGRVKQGDKQ